MNERLRKWAALTVVPTGMPAAEWLAASGVALGRDPGPCYEAYLQSGLTEQMTFDDFRDSYADTLCATDDLAATHGGQVPGETR